MKKYFKVIEEPNNECKYVYYKYKICWIPKEIINDDDVDGYIVQKVKFDNTLDMIINEDKKNHLEYYEAWKVKNQRIIYDDNSNEKYDDGFICGEYAEFDYIKKSLYKNGKICYDTQVYWIGRKNKLYSIVDNWKNNTVKMAKNLKSILVENCPQLDDFKPVFKRELFIHEVAFESEKDIKNELIKIYNKWKNKNNCINAMMNAFSENDYLIKLVQEIQDENSLKYLEN